MCDDGDEVLYDQLRLFFITSHIKNLLAKIYSQLVIRIIKLQNMYTLRGSVMIHKQHRICVLHVKTQFFDSFFCNRLFPILRDITHRKSRVTVQGKG